MAQLRQSSDLQVDSGSQTLGQKIRIRGLVQGVGFRPHVWTLAHELSLVGDVCNDGEGVLIHVWGELKTLDEFCRSLEEKAPPLARIDSVERTDIEAKAWPLGFSILESEAGPISTTIIPDAATCEACLEEVRDPNNRRYRYPFTNCTHCGPRLTITKSLPYDRATTSMASFIMCDDCQREYDDPSDRRFHAQPNACSRCGPKIWLVDREGTELTPKAGGDVVSRAVELLNDGKILAVKGLGGFHLVCDAANENAVATLRQRKKRYGKPLALMARDLGMVAKYAELSDAAKTALTSSAAPIVLMKRKTSSVRLSMEISPGHNYLGFMLPYTPLHHLLLENADVPLVMTSGNISNEPQVIGNEEALTKLNGIADFWLMHDRDIVNRLDDSVVQIVMDEPACLRRARGMAPEPLVLPDGFEGVPDILALGAEIKNTFCMLGKGKTIVSQHIGDLEDAVVHEDFRQALNLYHQANDFIPQEVAVDLHPNYFSTRWGERLSTDPIRVQHHHAHVAACLVEHGIPMDSGPVLGVVLDGLGHGGDGELWGGEFLIANYRHYERASHFKSVAAPGGERAAKEPWRNTFAHIDAALGWSNVSKEFPTLELVQCMSTKPLQQISMMIDKNLNSPKMSSAGRLFDAVAGAIGLHRDGVQFEGQAAMELQALAELNTESTIGYGFDEADPFSWHELWGELIVDLSRTVPAAHIAAKFHHMLVNAISHEASRICKLHNLKSVVLSGGVFQNRLLVEGVTEKLRDEKLEVLMPRKFPANDGGISLGQAVICAASNTKA